jgi:hypothetical protein
MPAETFYCPNCKRQLTKSAQAYVLGESMTTPGAHFIALGSMPDTIKCPGCGGAIDNRKMLMGEYDTRSGKAGDSNSGGVVGFLVLAGLIAIAVYFIWFR